MAQIIKELKTEEQWKFVAEYHGFPKDKNATADEHAAYMLMKINQTLFDNAIKEMVDLDPEVVSLKEAYDAKVEEKKAAIEDKQVKG